MLLKRFAKSENGQAIVLTVVSLALLMACIGLAVDVGTLFNAKRKVQIAADAGAVAGALELAYNGSSNVSTSVDNAAMANGITNSNQITVTPSPTDGYHQGSGFVEVVVRQPNPTFFMGIFVPGKVKVAARAVAGITPAPSCGYVLDPTAKGALSLQGNATINSAGCGWDVNSNDPQAACITGGSALLNAPYVRFRATTITPAGNCNGTLSIPTFKGTSIISDPLGGLSAPAASACSSPGGTTVTASTLTVGASDPNAALTGIVCFTNKVTISGTGTLGVTGTATTYVFNGGVEINGGANITVPNGTFVINQNPGTLKEPGGQSCIGSGKRVGMIQDSNSELYITAPGAGVTAPYPGVSILEPTGNTSPLEIQFGSSSSGSSASGVVNGIIYAPSAPVFLHDNGGTASATGLIADTLNVCSSTLNITSYNNYPGNASPLNKIALVE